MSILCHTSSSSILFAFFVLEIREDTTVFIFFVRLTKKRKEITDFDKRAPLLNRGPVFQTNISINAIANSRQMKICYTFNGLLYCNLKRLSCVKKNLYIIVPRNQIIDFCLHNFEILQ